MSNNSLEIISLLIQAGANPFIKDNNGHIPLEVCSSDNIKQHILQEINIFKLKQQQQQTFLLNKIENYEKGMLEISKKINMLENLCADIKKHVIELKK